jgi:hypothetical protein
MAGGEVQHARAVSGAAALARGMQHQGSRRGTRRRATTEEGRCTMEHVGTGHLRMLEIAPENECAEDVYEQHDGGTRALGSFIRYMTAIVAGSSRLHQARSLQARPNHTNSICLHTSTPSAP